MKNYNLFIVCFLIFLGVSAQERNTNNRTTKNLTKATYTLAYSMEDYEAMIKRCKELTAKFIAYEKMAQKGYMKTALVTEWKRDLVEAKLLNYRIDDYTAMYQRKNPELSEYIKQEILNNYANFSKTLDNSIQYAAGY